MFRPRRVLRRRDSSVGRTSHSKPWAVGTDGQPHCSAPAWRTHEKNSYRGEAANKPEWSESRTRPHASAGAAQLLGRVGARGFQRFQVADIEAGDVFAGEAGGIEAGQCIVALGHGRFQIDQI